MSQFSPQARAETYLSLVLPDRSLDLCFDGGEERERWQSCLGTLIQMESAVHSAAGCASAGAPSAPPAGRPSLAGRASSVDSGAGDDDDDDATPAAAGGGGGAPTAPTAAAGGGAPVVAGIDARGIAATIALGSTTRTAELLRKLSEGLDGDNDVMMPSSLPRS